MSTISLQSKFPLSFNNYQLSFSSVYNFPPTRIPIVNYQLSIINFQRLKFSSHVIPHYQLSIVNYQLPTLSFFEIQALPF